MDTVLNILGVQKTKCSGSITDATIEMKDIFQERLPYYTILLLEGVCYVWNETFIENCVKAMSTDTLAELTAEEKAIWYAYVLWSDHNTHSVDTIAEPNGVGCTIPDENGNSYVVLEDGTVTNSLCLLPVDDISKPGLYKSLDNAFIAWLNCEPINKCVEGAGKDVEVVTTCPDEE